MIALDFSIGNGHILRAVRQLGWIPMVSCRTAVGYLYH